MEGNDWINLNYKTPEDNQIILIYVPENDKEEQILLAKFSRNEYFPRSEAITFPVCADFNGTYSQEYKVFEDFVFYMSLPHPPKENQ
jgi:hypothetical protein